ncbi:MAG TPA: M3 family oligoendopeptidase [candidate division Zixibacteria bacterium]|nr:M3 family oligoendopeptidase [candidate division Zixibacteria bacterium]
MSHTATHIPAAPTWDLDSIFPGGSASAEYKAFREKVKKDLAGAATAVDRLPAAITPENRPQWAAAISTLQSILADLELLLAFASCLKAQNVSDTLAHAADAEGEEDVAQWKKLMTRIEAMSLQQSDAAWQLLTAAPELRGTEFFLNEVRETARRKMPVEKEELALDLAVNGYHTWNQLYDKMAGDLREPFEEGGQTKLLSMGQIATKMSSPDREVRRRAFEAMTNGWKRRQDLAAMALNAQAGFRLSLYKYRGWDLMYEPLHNARLQEATLDTMWRVIAEEKKRLRAYVDAKKRLLGIDRFRWYDEFAPAGRSDRQYSFAEAGDFVVAQVRSFSDDMADFYRRAIDSRWVEAEDRAGKAGGAFCTGFGPVRQSRVFMTYGGSFENLLTLAHELGHAYHQQVITEKPYFAQQYPMPLAETASIFSETLVTDAALGQAADAGERLMLLDQKLQSAYVMFTDLHCRYIFDRAFYAERRNGMVPAERLSEMMVTAQKEAFAGMLDDSGCHPLFWASKLHFYMTSAPFYNFPYVFGFLFAGGVYDRAKREGKKFAKDYRALLADTGSMTCEELARTHLGVDLADEGFWRSAVDRALAEVEAYVKLAKSM